MQNSEFRIQKSRAPRVGRLAVSAFCILHSAFLAAGCATKAKAATTVPDGPPLAMPSPPPRVITLAEEPPPPLPATPLPEPSVSAPKPATTKPPVVRADPPPVVPQQPPPPAVAAEPPREVRSVPTAAAAAEERKVRDVMQRATRDLNRVDYQRLSADGKSQYDQSKRFSEQADQAIKEKNYVYAMTLADKAAMIASELAGR